MEYGLRPDEQLAAGVRRIACTQVDQAIGELSSARDPHRSVHEARKCMKRVRSLLHLIRPAIGKKTFQKENRRVRDIGRLLSGPRDCQAIIETIGKLENGAGATLDTAGTQALKAKLHSERQRAEQDLYQSKLEEAITALSRIRSDFRDLRLKGGTARIGDGLQRCYRRARHDFKRAYERQRPEDFHGWRKSAQRHWRQMQLLLYARPETVEARITAASELSKVLGEDHDLAVLMERVEAQKKSLGAGWDMKVFQKACTDRQKELRVKARDLGKFLFVERPSNFRERMDAYWSAARDTAKSKNAASGKGQSKKTATAGKTRSNGQAARTGTG